MICTIEAEGTVTECESRIVRSPDMRESGVTVVGPRAVIFQSNCVLKTTNDKTLKDII